jgi:hypothetical protein
MPGTKNNPTAQPVDEVCRLIEEARHAARERMPAALEPTLGLDVELGFDHLGRAWSAVQKALTPPVPAQPAVRQGRNRV